MKSYLFLLAIAIVPLCGSAQSVIRLDSLVNSDLPIDSYANKIDSVDQKAIQKIDSIQTSFKTKTDSLQQLYQKPLNEIEQLRSSAQHKLDSLNKLHLPTEKLTRKIDSLTSLQSKKLAELNQKVDQLKDKTTAGLKQVTLPPQMQEPVDKLTQSIKSYVPTLPNGKLQEFKFPSGDLALMKDLKLPEVKNLNQLTTSIPKSEELNKLTGELGKVRGVTTEVTALAKDAQSIASGKLNEAKQIDKTIEKQVLKIDEVKEFQKQAGAVNPLSDADLTGADPEALKKQAAEMVKKEAMATIKTEATNHFAGKQEMLQKSMDKMTKLKGKYSEVKSMAELPKKTSQSIT